MKFTKRVFQKFLVGSSIGIIGIQLFSFLFDRPLVFFPQVHPILSFLFSFGIMLFFSLLVAPIAFLIEKSHEKSEQKRIEQLNKLLGKK